MVETTAQPAVMERYIQALEGADPIESQRKAPKRLKKLLKGLSEKQLARRPAPDQWSIKEIVAHLADGEVILGSRVRFVAAQDRPALPGYDQDLFVARLGIEKVKTKALCEAFSAARALNVALLERLPESALDRVGLHLERGEESIRTMVTMYAGHDVLHERKIRALRAALLAPEPKEKPKSKSKTRPSTESLGAKQARKAEKKARKAAKSNGAVRVR